MAGINPVKHSRRAFIAAGAALSAVPLLRPAGAAVPPAHATPESLLALAKSYAKIDAHNHVGGDQIRPEDLIESCDRLGINQAVVSLPRGDTPELFRAANDTVLQAIKRYPDRLLGQCFLNPQYPKESMEELHRCLSEGFIGMGELYAQVRLTDPAYFPLIEKCIENNASILMHVRADTGLLRPGIKSEAAPTTTIPDDFVEVARRYPEAILIHSHIGGGGDWEYMCKKLRNSPSVFVDTSGSVTDEGMIDFAKEHLGVARMLFATDTNFETGVGKILAATLTEEERRQIFFENMSGILKRRGIHAH